MTKLEQAARQLLQVLDCGMIDINRVTALREALEHPEQDWPSGGEAEQAEQEPVAWRWSIQDDWGYVSKKEHADESMQPLYAAPVRTKDLTDAHILVLWQETANPDAHRIERFARAVIAADREKNK